MKTFHKLVEEGNFEEVQKIISTNSKLVNEPDDKGTLPLHHAAWEGHKNILELLIAHGAKINIATEKARTPLFQAIKAGHDDIVETLLSKGANPNYTHVGCKVVPLIEAVLEERVDIAKLLIDYGADIDFKLDLDHTALSIALHEKKIKMALWLIQHGAKTDTVLKDGSNLLHWAIYSGNSEIVKLLIQTGLSVNAASHSGNTPLYMGALLGHAELVKILISSGADINLTGKDESSPLLIALEKGHDEAAKALILAGADISWHHSKDDGIRDFTTTLHLAVEKGCEESAELLIDMGADIEAENGRHLTPLYVAFKRGKKAIAKLLIDKGADIFKRAPDDGVRGGLANTTSLHLAAEEGWCDIAETLIIKGVKVNLKNKLGHTPLHEAVYGGHKDVANLLIVSGADINSVEKNKYTPLNYALSANNCDMAEFLINKGADVNISDADGVTPLHRAIENDLKSIIRLFIQKEAHVNARAKNDMIPLHWAAVKGNKEIAEILIANGAELEAKTGDGWTPLKLAADHGHIPLVDFFKSKGANPDIIENDGRTKEQRNKWKMASWRSDNGELPEVVQSRIIEKYQRPIEELFEAINDVPRDQNKQSSVILSNSQVQKEAVDLLTSDGQEGISVISTYKPYKLHLKTDVSLSSALSRYKNLQKEETEMHRAMRASVMADARLWGYSDSKIEDDNFYPAYDKVIDEWDDFFKDCQKKEYGKIKAVIKTSPTTKNIKFLKELLFSDEVDFYEETDLLDFLFSLPSQKWQEDFLEIYNSVGFENIWKHDVFFAILNYGNKFKNKAAVKQLFEKWSKQLSEWMEAGSVPENKSILRVIFGYDPDRILREIREAIEKLFDDSEGDSAKKQ